MPGDKIGAPVATYVDAIRPLAGPCHVAACPWQEFAILAQSRTWPIRLGSKDARAAVASTAPTTRVHRAAGRIICRSSIAAGSASAAIATAAGRG